MKVYKEKEDPKYGGYNIYCVVGDNTYKSYWSGPPKSVDHAGLKYLKARYPVITTKTRVTKFKKLYKLLWIDVTDSQRGKMENALGLAYSKKPYRNRFQTRSNDKEWDDLVDKGLATKGKVNKNGLCWFWLTKIAVEYILGKSVTENMYQEL